MRKPRDFDAQLKALDERTKQLKARRVQQLGELVIATGGDGLTIDELAGALLTVAKSDPATREGWRKAGAAFFRKSVRKAGGGSRRDGAATSAGDGGTLPLAEPAGAP